MLYLFYKKIQINCTVGENDSFFMTFRGVYPQIKKGSCIWHCAYLGPSKLVQGLLIGPLGSKMSLQSCLEGGPCRSGLDILPDAAKLKTASCTALG